VKPTGSSLVGSGQDYLTGREEQRQVPHDDLRRYGLLIHSTRESRRQLAWCERSGRARRAAPRTIQIGVVNRALVAKQALTTLVATWQPGLTTRYPHLRDLLERSGSRGRLAPLRLWCHLVANLGAWYAGVYRPAGAGGRSGRRGRRRLEGAKSGTPRSDAGRHMILEDSFLLLASGGLLLLIVLRVPRAPRAGQPGHD
jgi:hypothetical protein